MTSASALGERPGRSRLVLQLTASGVPPELCSEIKENPSFILLKTGFPLKFQKASWIQCWLRSIRSKYSLFKNRTSVVNRFLQWLWLCRQQTQRSLTWGTRWTRRARWHGVYTLVGNKTKKQLSEPQCISPVLAGAATDGGRRARTTKCVSNGSAEVWE